MLKRIDKIDNQPTCSMINNSDVIARIGTFKEYLSMKRLG